VLYLKSFAGGSKNPRRGASRFFPDRGRWGKPLLCWSWRKSGGGQALYAAADAPEASLPGWWEIQWRRAEQLAQNRPALFLLDEIQYLGKWSRLLKSQADGIRRRKSPLQVIISGSSSLQLGTGARESMAGRFERLHLLHWPAIELMKYFHFSADEAVNIAVARGGYPGAVTLLNDPSRWKEYIRNSIVEPAIGRDIIMLESIRKPALLRQLFAICIGHPAETISLQKLCGQLSERGALETVAHYLHVLEDACIVASLQKYSSKTLRQRSSPPKVITLN
jgi:uncharacterized protein